MSTSSIEELFREAARCFNEDGVPEAVRLASEIVNRQADHGPATRLLGVIAHQLGDLDRSERLLRKALRLGQESPELLAELVRLFVDSEQWDKASSCCERSLHLYPDHVDAFISLGFVKNAQQDYASAQNVYHRGLDAFPDNTTLLNNLAALHRENGNLEAAIHLINDCEGRLGIPAPMQECRGRALLQLRRWVEGWHDYEARLQIDSETKPQFNPLVRRWTGESLEGKHLFVLCEQGIGDEVQFASCFADLIRQTHKCTLSCSPRLEPIYRRSFPDAVVVALTDQERLCPQPVDHHRYDFVVAAGSVPRYLRNTDESFPQQPFLLPEEIEVKRYRHGSSLLRVGVSWWGGSQVVQMKQRSIAFKTFSRLFDVPDVQFVNLQHGRCDEQTAKGELARFSNLRTHHEINPYIDLNSWMNLIASLDLVISVDNSNAHFAGSLGVPTWLLLPEKPNWRWPYDVEQSQWYSRVRFFRQQSGRDWDTTINRVCEQLTSTRDERTV